MNRVRSLRHPFRKLLLTFCLLISLTAAFVPATVSADPDQQGPAGAGATNSGGPQCGSGENAVRTSIDFGCKGQDCVSTNPHGCSALVDAIFAVVRILTTGVGIIISGSTIFAGIQYMTARDDPGAVGKAKDRIRGNIIALLLFIFGYALLNYLIPAGFFQ